MTGILVVSSGRDLPGETHGASNDQGIQSPGSIQAKGPGCDDSTKRGDMNRLKLAPVAAVVCLGLVTSACGSGQASAGPTTTTTAYTGPVAQVVIIKGGQYTPSTATIQVGQTVEWKWEDPRIHNVVFAAGFSSPSQTTGTWYHTFNSPGSFFYRCTFHPNMVGEVIVKPA